MRRRRRPHQGEGTAWLVADRSRGDYQCFWYVGTGGSHLVEKARASSAEEAIGWGRQRTDRVRIRTAEPHTYWAGARAAPDGFADAWTAPEPLNVVARSGWVAERSRAGPLDEPPGPSPLSLSPSPDQPVGPPERRQLVDASHRRPGGAPC